MKKSIIAMFAAVVAALSMNAGAANVESVPVDVVIPAKVTQVVVTDGDKTYVMATEQEVKDWVTVTPEMAKTAQVVSLLKGDFPEITSVKQAANNGESEASATPFSKTGVMEPIATNLTVVNMVFFRYKGDVYSFETKDAVGETIEISESLLKKSQKV